MNTSQRLPPAEEREQRVLEELQRWGVQYLVGSRTLSPRLEAPQALAKPYSAARLLAEIALTQDIRIRESLIALLILHPELCAQVETARHRLRLLRHRHIDPTTTSPYTSQQVLQAERDVVTLALAAWYLRAKWLPRLTLALGSVPTFPVSDLDPYRQERQLPPPSCRQGECGLEMLAAWAEMHQDAPSGLRLDYIRGWEDHVQRLIQFIWWQRQTAAPATPPSTSTSAFEQAIQEMRPDSACQKEQECMSLRHDADRADIERFLHELGQTVHTSGRIYLVGDAEPVHSQVRGMNARTVDIDLRLEVGDPHEVEMAIRQLIVRLGVNVELASPLDFIPVPASWERLSQYVGRYGSLDVFYFDFVTLSLAKISRGQSRDVQDVELLAQQGLIQRVALEAAYTEILPQLGFGRYFNIDPMQFQQAFTAMVQHLWGATP